MKPRLLDLFCCQGGAGEGYRRAGFDVTGVDIEPQPRNPHRFVQADALEYLAAHGHEFDAIHASPPCQAHSTLKARHRDTHHPDLVDATRALLDVIAVPYVIENVVGAPLQNPVMLCGSSFGLDVRRHRLFESTVPLMAMPCAHHWQTARFDVYEHGKWIKSPVVRVYGTGGGKAREHWADAMGIDWMDDAGLAQAIPPAYTEHIGAQLLQHLTLDVAA